MTDDTRVLRTNGMLDEFHTGVDDLVVTPAGVEVTEEQYKQIRDVGFAHGAQVYLDEEFDSVPEGKDAVLEVPAFTPADPKLGGGGKAAPMPAAQKADGDTNGGTV